MESNVSMLLSLTTVACTNRWNNVRYACICFVDGAYSFPWKKKRFYWVPLGCSFSISFYFIRRNKFAFFSFYFVYCSLCSQRQSHWEELLRKKEEKWTAPNECSESKVDMFFEIYLDSWDHKLNEKLYLLYLCIIFYFQQWRESHKHTSHQY